MWLIPSRQRPHRLRHLIEASRKTKMSTDAVVLVDKDDPCLKAYLSLLLLPKWTIEIGPPGGLSDIYNQAFMRYPDEDWYGVLGDDVIPETDYWDIELAGRAVPGLMAIPSGGHHSVVAPHFVLGGELPRAYGWLFLPGLDRIYLDTVWNDIAGKLGVAVHVPEVVLSHHHFSNGKALVDKTYKKHHKSEDKVIYERWKKAYEFVWKIP